MGCPAADGTLCVTAVLGGGARGDEIIAGVKCDPVRGELQTLWKASGQFPAPRKMDFDAGTLIGVSTNYCLVTSLIDLRSDAVLLTIDNSASYRAYVDRERRYENWPQLLPVLLAGIALIGLAFVALRKWRRRIRAARR